MSNLVCKPIFKLIRTLLIIFMAYTLKNEAGMCPRVTLTVQLEKLDFQAST